MAERILYVHCDQECREDVRVSVSTARLTEIEYDPSRPGHLLSGVLTVVCPGCSVNIERELVPRQLDLAFALGVKLKEPDSTTPINVKKFGKHPPFPPQPPSPGAPMAA